MNDGPQDERAQVGQPGPSQEPGSPAPPGSAAPATPQPAGQPARPTSLWQHQFTGLQSAGLIVLGVVVVLFVFDCVYQLFQGCQLFDKADPSEKRSRYIASYAISSAPDVEVRDKTEEITFSGWRSDGAKISAKMCYKGKQILFSAIEMEWTAYQNDMKLAQGTVYHPSLSAGECGLAWLVVIGEPTRLVVDVKHRP